jgi:RNA recognition motif-containing protein
MGRGSEEGSRPPRDKSTRRVEVRNLPPNLPPMELGTLFNECGERAHTDTEELARGGSVYLHFFDARAAEACVEKMNGKQVGGRSLDVSFLFGNDTSGVEAVNTGTLWIRVRGRSLSHEDMRQRFSQYGALRDVRNARGSLDVFFVEYYDLRDCERAFLQHRDPDVSLEYAKAQGPPSRGGARGGRVGGGRDAPHRGGGGSGGGYGGGAAPSGGFGAFGAGGLGGLTGGGAAPRDPRLG